MNPFQKFVSEHARLFQSGKKLPPGRPQKFPRHRKVPDHAPKALIFSPHPDDECIVGGLALRLLREAKWNVINVAVTLGGKIARRTERLRELQGACDFLGFGLAVADWEDINPVARRENYPSWRAAVEIVAEILAEQQPHAIFVPHENDRHPTHIGTHFLVLDALKTLPARFECHVVETEFWGQMTDPNLLSNRASRTWATSWRRWRVTSAKSGAIRITRCCRRGCWTTCGAARNGSAGRAGRRRILHSPRFTGSVNGRAAG